MNNWVYNKYMREYVYIKAQLNGHMLRAIQLRICCLYLFRIPLSLWGWRYMLWLSWSATLSLLQVKDPPPLSQSFVFPEHDPDHAVPGFPFLAPRHVFLVWINFLPI